MTHVAILGHAPRSCRYRSVHPRCRSVHRAGAAPAYVSPRASIAERARNSAGGIPYSSRNARLTCAALKKPQRVPIAATGR
jgi:hypothetical protein